MTSYLWVPIVFQALAMSVDEFYFHHRRGLGTWERWGHPLDTLTVLAVFLWSLISEPTVGGQIVFASLAVFSSLFVTKDEKVHTEVCSAGEHWLHSLLFLIHPVTFVALFVLWQDNFATSLLGGVSAEIFISAQVVLLITFAVYQVTYWGWVWKPSK